MAMTDYETVLREAQQLTAEEQLRLMEVLAEHAAAPPSALNAIRNKVVHLAPLTDDERAATLAALESIDRTATQIGKAWQGHMSAADAVKEQRRDL